MKKLFAFIAIVLSFLPVATFAHPGHGETEGFSIIHYMLEPAHLFIAIVLVGVAGILLFRRRKEENK